MIPDAEATPREHALSYYDDFGWFVIPTDPGLKKPYYGFQYKERYGDSLPDRQEVISWEEWNKQGVRVGTRTGAVSGIIVLDVDSQEAHEYVKTRQHSVCPMVQTPREGGGIHLYFKHPGFYIGNTVGLGGVEGLDFRGDGGIAVLPPSMDHKAGRGYEWIIPPHDVAVPDAPGWLLDLLQKQSTFKPKFDPATMWEGIPEGQRDTELQRFAGKMRQLSLPQDSAIDMMEMAAERCNPPFNRAAAKAKVIWAYRHYEAGEDPATMMFHVPPLIGENMEHQDFPPPVSLGSLEKPGPRQWLVDNLVPMKYPTTLYGSGGVAKSYLALSLGMALAQGEEKWLGFNIKSGPVLYLDFELEVEEQTRRGYEVAEGMGLKKPPMQLHYECAGGMRMMEAFQRSLHWCREWDIKLLIVDSTGLALEGDSERASDVIAFFREVVGQFTQVGTCVLLIDHQSKLQQGDNYQKKSAFGSAYKGYLARSAVQVELMNRADGEITVRFRHQKTNFGSITDPFEVRVFFRGDEVAIERIALDDADLATEESIGSEERVISAIRHLGDATPKETEDLTGLGASTVRKQYSQLKKHNRIEETGEERDGSQAYRLREEGQMFRVPTYKGENTEHGNEHAKEEGTLEIEWDDE